MCVCGWGGGGAVDNSSKLSLYSNVMQHLRVGALRWSRPPTPEFRIGDTNMLVSKNADICKTPMPVSGICGNIFALAMYISCITRFSFALGTAVLSGIRALVTTTVEF